MIINYWAVLVCAILSMVLGGIWFGPLFGRKWAEIVGVNPDDMAARKEMQKRAAPLYVVQFILSVFQAMVLAYFIGGWEENMSGIMTALLICVGFVLPMVAGASMWNNDSARVSWSRFLIQSGYQLVLFGMFCFILGMWK